MHRFCLPPLLLAFCLSFIGCDTVSSLHPVGEPIVDDQITLLDSDIDAGSYFEGVWTGPKGSDLVCNIKYLGEGNLRGTFVKWNDGELDLSDPFHIKLTRHEDATYLNIYTPDKIEEDGYMFTRLLPTDQDSAVLLLPRANYFVQAISDLRVAGEIKSEENPVTLKLTCTKDELDALIRQDEVGTQFGLEMPLLFKRVASPSQ